MTLDEFENAHPLEGAALSAYTGCYTARHADWIRKGARMDVVGVYEDQGTWIAHVDSASGFDQCKWFPDYVRPDPHMTYEPGAWRWLGAHGRPCDSQGREEDAVSGEPR